VSDTLSERSISPLPPFPTTAPLYRCFLVHHHSAGCSHHQPPQPAAPHTPEGHGPPSPTPATRRSPPSACAPADRARVRVAATDCRRGRWPVVGAAPATGAAVSHKGGRQGRGRRPAIGYQRRGRRHAAREAARGGGGASGGSRGQGRGQRQRRGRRQQGGWRPAAVARARGGGSASGGGGVWRRGSAGLQHLLGLSAPHLTGPFE